MPIDVSIQFNGHNSYRVAETVFCKPFGVQGMAYVTHSFHAYAASALGSATRARTRFFKADGSITGTTDHAFTVAAVFTEVDITVAVPALSVLCQVSFLTSGTWWVVEPKSEEGETATPYNTNYAGQLSYITPDGAYLGMLTTAQIVVAGTLGDPTESLYERLITINNNAITLTSGLGTVTAKTTLITALGVYTGEIVASQITTGSLAAARIAAGSLTADKLAAGTITAASGVIGSIDASKITTGTLDASLITVINMIAQTVTNSPTADFYMISGDETIDAVSYSGVFGYIKSYSEAIPFFKILGKYTDGTPNSHTLRIFLLDKYELFMRYSDTGSRYITLGGKYGTNEADMPSFGMMRNASGTIKSISMSQGANSCGVDDTGFYKYIGATKTYL